MSSNLTNFIGITRLDKPIGFLLLFWPCSWGLSLGLYFQKDLNIDSSWRFSGVHYERTSLAWLNKMDSRKKQIMEIFNTSYGNDQAAVWFQRWRIFFMACEVLFGYDGGKEWGVSHYRFVKPGG